MTDYNGWTNYETWNYNLWKTNDEDQHDLCIEFLDEASEPQYDWQTKKSNAIHDLEQYLKGELEDQANDNMYSNPMFSDLMQAAIDSINFHEVVENWIDDVYEEWVNTNDDEKTEDEEE
jgi:hypothetical protein